MLIKGGHKSKGGYLGDTGFKILCFVSGFQLFAISFLSFWDWHVHVVRRCHREVSAFTAARSTRVHVLARRRHVCSLIVTHSTIRADQAATGPRLQLQRTRERRALGARVLPTGGSRSGLHHPALQTLDAARHVRISIIMRVPPRTFGTKRARSRVQRTTSGTRKRQATAHQKLR